MFEFRLRHGRMCPQVGSEPRFSQMEVVRGRGASCAKVWWGNAAVRVQRVLGSGVERILWPDPRWFLWASELLFIPAEVSERLLERFPPSSHSPAIAAQLLIEHCHVPGQCQHLLTLYIAVSSCTHLSLPQTFYMLLSTTNICLGFKPESFGK